MDKLQGRFLSTTLIVASLSTIPLVAAFVLLPSPQLLASCTFYTLPKVAAIKYPVRLGRIYAYRK